MEIDHSDVVALKLMHCCENYLMGFNGVLKHQIYSAEYFGTTLFFSGFVAKGVALFQRDIHPISITIITGRTNVGSILCR